MVHGFLFFIIDFSFMIEHDHLKHEENIENILDRLISLFQQNGLTELSQKWDKILKNYYINRKKD